MDAFIRQLEHDAARGAPDAVARLAAALERLGRQALVYTGPDPVPMRVVAPPRRDSPDRASKYGNRRHQVICAAAVDALDRAVETRTRRVGRSQCESGYQEWLEDQCE